MKQTTTLMAFLAALTLTTATGCQKDTGNGTAPRPEHFSLSGTAWISAHDEWWTPSMHVIDTSIWRFMTDSTGTIYEHRTYNGDDPYGGSTYPMTYSFDTCTLTGLLHGYEEPVVFTYHSEDTTLTYGTFSIITYHLLSL